MPALLVFGPQTELPSGDVLVELRRVLVSDHRLSDLVQAVEELPQFWRELTTFDPSLGRVPGASYLEDLRRWIKDGDPFPHHLSQTPNVYCLPVTVILQVIQYSRYLTQLQGEDPHRLLLRGIQAGGIQGFCVGFLSAVAVASSENEGKIGSAAAKSLQMAVCIGAYVDRDGKFAEEPEEMVCVAIRWKSDDGDYVHDLVQKYSEVSQKRYLEIEKRVS